jgi:L-ascorbate metabolism protein UlaG (beta-lactamase superfamily)
MRHIASKIDIKIAEIDGQMEFELEPEDDVLKFWAVPAYNVNKNFHAREDDWVGYIIQVDGVLIYHAGDTDMIPEMKKLKETGIDIAFLPIGGTYTMNAGEAAKAASLIKPKLVVPMHYGTVERTGAKSDADVFAKLCTAGGLDVKVMEKEKQIEF